MTDGCVAVAHLINPGPREEARVNAVLFEESTNGANGRATRRKLQRISGSNRNELQAEAHLAHAADEHVVAAALAALELPRGHGCINRV